MSSKRETAPREDRDLYYVMAVLAIGSFSLAFALGPGALSVMSASLLVLFLPGYALVEAVRPPQMDLVQRLVTSIATSLAVVILVGIALNWLPGGIDRASELSSLSGITVLGAAVAWVRRRKLRREVESTEQVSHFRVSVAWGTLMACVAAIVLAATGIGIARRAAIHQQRTDSPTQLWLLPGSSRTRSVRIGVKNTDSHRSTYRLQLTDGTAVVKEWSSIILPAGATWTASVDVPPARAHDRLEAALYRTGRQSMYRWVTDAERP